MHKRLGQHVDIIKKEFNLRSRSIQVLKPYEKSETNKRTRENFESNITIDDGVDTYEKGTWSDFNKLQVPNFVNNNVNISNDQNMWVSATKVKNYLLKDTIIDWLDIYYKNLGFNENVNSKVVNINKKVKLHNNNTEKQNQKLFFEMGNQFEKKVIEYLTNTYPTHIKKVVHDYVNPKDNDITMQYMLEGVPIIEQAALYNYSNKTFGVADLLIRSDWINKLFEQNILPLDMEHFKASNLKGPYHYVVIDIKWTTMHFCINGVTLRNNDRFPAYKGQLTIYNAALGQLQGYSPSSAYILAKSWVIESSRNKFEGHNCFTKLGHIDFDGFDNKYIKATSDAIIWIRNVRYNGSYWSLNKPTVPELYPNMCNKLDNPYHGIKQTLAKDLHELTEIWMVGPKNREIAHKQNILSWSDKKCSAKTLGINGKKVGPVVDKIISINRDNKALIKPKIITNNVNDWQTWGPHDFFIDFETLSGTLYDEINILNSKSINPFLFMIGVGYVNSDNDDKIWSYKSFICNSVTLNEEKRILNEFTTFIDDLVGPNNENKVKMYHWSPAERTIITSLNRRHGQNWLSNVVWCDIYKLFLDVPITIKGVKKFNLKDVAKVMKQHNMIKSDWPNNGIGDGLTAMVEAISYYKNKESNSMLMKHVTDYNELDCKIVFEIVEYLRNNHTK